MALVLFIRKFPKLGIYVVMFTSILYTFLKFFVIYVLFLVAFALSFYTLLHDPQVRLNLLCCKSLRPEFYSNCNILTSVFRASVLLLIINFVITLSII